MSLSPHELEVLARIEEELRDEDPALVSALSRTPLPSPTTSTFRSPVSVRQVLLLLGALTILTALAAVLAEQLGVLGLAALTLAAIVPWLVVTARSSDDRSPGPDIATRGPRSTDRNVRGPSGRTMAPAVERGALIVAVVVVTALVLAPSAWQPALTLTLLLLAAALLPRLIVYVVEQIEGAGSPGPRRDRRTGPGSPAR